MEADMTILSEPPPPTTSRAGSTDRGAVADQGFERRLIDGIRPIAEHFLAGALYHLFDSGLFDQLVQHPDGVRCAALAGTLDLDEDRVRGLLLFLANEGVVQIEDDGARLTLKGRQYGEFRPWYTMLVGGYSLTLGQLGRALRRGAPFCDRDGRKVGIGSCEISRYDGIPMTRNLLAEVGVDCREVLDLGCGSALCLVELCRAMPGVRAWGVEPDAGGYDEARQLVARVGMADRVRLAHRSATEFLRDPPPECDPDVIVFAYVLQEILAQEGEEAILSLLREIVDRFPSINIVVIEVSNEIANPSVMRHGLASNFWNPYFLIHYFTNQRLETRAHWDDLFERAGLDVAAFTTTDPAVDSTGLELGYLLRRRADDAR
jgi:2-ketoarginine methyltransferase